jgi:hypothetical protein
MYSADIYSRVRRAYLKGGDPGAGAVPITQAGRRMWN